MRVLEKKGRKWVKVDPGEYFATSSKLIMETLLGSCVSACLFDPVSGICGMNHFLLSVQRNPSDKPLFTSDAARYGVHSMEMLINKMIGMGANRKTLRAKAFGGGNVLPIKERQSIYNVGKINEHFILNFLEIEKIPLDAHSLGGDHGRVILFDTENYSVYVRKIPRINEEKLREEEREYWKKTVEAQKQREPKIDLW